MVFNTETREMTVSRDGVVIERNDEITIDLNISENKTEKKN